jgi:DNA-binding HxlR family transcriptional regulator
MSRRRSESARRSLCAVNHAVEVLGDQWTLLVLRELAIGHSRTYSQLKEMEEGIASNILTDRLAHLQDAGLVDRVADPDDGRRVLYDLTESGRRVVPILLELMVWSWYDSPDVGITAELVGRIEQDRDAAVADVLGSLDRSAIRSGGD